MKHNEYNRTTIIVAAAIISGAIAVGVMRSAPLAALVAAIVVGSAWVAIRIVGARRNTRKRSE